MWPVALILIISGLFAVAGTVMLLRRRDEPVLDRVLLSWAPLALWVWVALSLLRLLELPAQTWNWHACRLAPVVAMTRGVPLYSAPDSGPISSHIYGPVWAIAMTPAALGSSVTSIILIGGVMTLLWYFAPLGFLLLRGAGSGAITFAAFTSAALWSAADSSLQGAAYWVHVDAVALGLAAVSCAMLISRPESNRPPIAALALSAIACAAAIWTKQTFAPIAVALPVVLWLRDGRRVALTYAALVLASLVGLGAIFAMSFGASNMLFNMFTVPSRHPLKGGDAVLALMDGAGHMLLHAAAPLLLLEFCILFNRGRAVRPFSAWLKQTHWALPAIVGIALVPTAVLGYAKAGGHANNLSGVVYFLLAAAVTCAARHGTRVARVSLLFFGLIAIVLAMGTPSTLLARIRAVAGAQPNSQEQAYQFALKHPSQVWFPWNTLSTLLADGKLYHFDYGVFDRRLAGLAPSQSHLHQCIPSDLRMIAIPERPPSDESLPGGIEPARLPDLPGFEVYILERAQP